MEAEVEVGVGRYLMVMELVVVQEEGVEEHLNREDGWRRVRRKRKMRRVDGEMGMDEIREVVELKEQGMVSSRVEEELMIVGWETNMVQRQRIGYDEMLRDFIDPDNKYKVDNNNLHRLNPRNHLDHRLNRIYNLMLIKAKDRCVNFSIR